jgi:hypothetical protein
MRITIDSVFIDRGTKIWNVIERDEANYTVVNFVARKQAQAYRAALLAVRSGSGSMAAVKAARAVALPER